MMERMCGITCSVEGEFGILASLKIEDAGGGVVGVILRNSLWIRFMPWIGYFIVTNSSALVG